MAILSHQPTMSYRNKNFVVTFTRLKASYVLEEKTLKLAASKCQPFEVCINILAIF